MKVVETVTQPVDVVTKVLCDMCGADCYRGPCGNEYADLNAHWGYESRKDGETWECILCEDCADKVRKFIESVGGKIIIGYYI